MPVSAVTEPMVAAKRVRLMAGPAFASLVVTLLVLNLSLGDKPIDTRSRIGYSIDDPQFVRAIGSVLAALRRRVETSIGLGSAARSRGIAVVVAALIGLRGGREIARRNDFVCTTERCKAVGGRAAALRCGSRRCAPTALRCSWPGGERRTRPRTGGNSLRELPVLGARTRCARRIAFGRCATPEPLRPSAPQRHFAARPPTVLRAAPSGSKTCASRRSVATRTAVANRRFTQRCGWAAGAAPLRRRAAQRSGGSPAHRAGPARGAYGPAPPGAKLPSSGLRMVRSTTRQ